VAGLAILWNCATLDICTQQQRDWIKYQIHSLTVDGAYGRAVASLISAVHKAIIRLLYTEVRGKVKAFLKTVSCLQRQNRYKQTLNYCWQISVSVDSPVYPQCGFMQVMVWLNIF